MDTKFKIRLPFLKKSREAKASAAAHKMRLGRDPYFDWTVILSLSIMTAVLCISFGYALWSRISAESYASFVASFNVQVPPNLPFNTAGFEKIVAGQSQKSSFAAEYEKGYSGPADPSL